MEVKKKTTQSSAQPQVFSTFAALLEYIKNAVECESFLFIFFGVSMQLSVAAGFKGEQDSTDFQVCYSCAGTDTG